MKKSTFKISANERKEKKARNVLAIRKAYALALAKKYNEDAEWYKKYMSSPL